MTKEIFLDKWHVDGSAVRESFGTPMAQGENNYLFDEIAKRCEQIDKEDFETKLAQFANVDDVVIITTDDCLLASSFHLRKISNMIGQEGVQQLDVQRICGVV